MVRRRRIAEALQRAWVAQGGLPSGRREVMAHSGHGSMKELIRYTKAADQARLARNALAKAVVR
jgi:hypothetical protein